MAGLGPDVGGERAADAARGARGRRDGGASGDSGAPDDTAERAANVSLGARDDVRAWFGSAYDGVRSFAELLAAEGETRGLIGPREVPRLWERHLLNSSAVVPFLPPTGSVIDVGSGAGLPGVVIAMMRPDLSVVLVEPMERRTAWLSEVTDRFALGNVEVRRGRAEEFRGVLIADAVTSRAVASLAKLARLSLPLVRPGGEMVVLKGRNAATEFDAARSVLRGFGASAPELLVGTSVEGVEPTTIVRVRRW